MVTSIQCYLGDSKSIVSRVDDLSQSTSFTAASVSILDSTDTEVGTPTPVTHNYGTYATASTVFNSTTYGLGVFQIIFSYTLSDTSIRQELFQLTVLSKADLYTFDTTTDRGSVRFFMDDMGPDLWIRTDPEIDLLLRFSNGGVAPSIPNTQSPSLIYKACSLGFEQNASSKAYRARVEATGQFRTDTKTVWQAMKDEADRFRHLALTETLPVLILDFPRVVPEPVPMNDPGNALSATPTSTSVMEYE